MNLHILGHDINVERVEKWKVDAATDAAHVTHTLRTLLESKEALVIEELLDAKHTTALTVELVERANNTLQMILASGDTSAFLGTLQRLGTELSSAFHPDGHTCPLGDWVHIFQGAYEAYKKLTA